MWLYRLSQALLLLTLTLGPLATAAPPGDPGLAPALELQGAAPFEGVKLAVTGAEFQRELHIQSTFSMPVSVKIVVTPLRDEAGRLWDITWEVEGKPPEPPVVVTPFGNIALTLKGRLPADGTYTGDILLLSTGEPSRTRLVITRGPAPLPVKVLELKPVQGTAEAFGSSSVQVRLSVQETSGEALVVTPTVLELSRVTRGQLEFQAPFVPLAAPPLKLAGGASLPTTLTVEGLDGAGEYKGTLRLASSTLQPVDQVFHVFLKEGWWVAFGWICAGIAVSLLFRWLVQSVRPRLETQRAALLLRQELGLEAQALEPQDTPGHRVLAGMLGEADLLVMRSGAGALKAQEAQAGLDALQGKRSLFPLWLAIRRQVQALRPASLRAPFQESLTQVENLLTGTAPAPAVIDAALKTLEKMPEEMTQAARGALRQALEALDTEVKVRRDLPASRLGRRLGAEVAPELEKAQALLAENQAAEAFTAYDRARESYVELLAEELASQVRGNPPLGFSTNDWEELRGRVLAGLEAARGQKVNLDAAFEAYPRAHRLFLTGITRALSNALDELKKDVDRSTELSPSQRTERKERIGKLEPLLQAVLEKIRLGQLSEAVTQYDAALTELRQATLGVKIRGQVTERLALAEASPAALELPLAGRPTPLGAAKDRTRAPLGSVTSWRRMSDVGISAFLALLAGILGVLALWQTDATWGGWTAHATALLWGLGLHQAAFSTVAGLADSLLGKKELA
ncbi:hypothetical protein [Stigmatella aurantiaca]|uniref:Conserved uncharacterized protein n=1 Tax=Stigmatella aurantiaca (strain DW4/3-1) TaxID=378806 RepID=Q09BJ7_STIAD|nr:hypothetical protein [Stigmatella aurantiaca]ADO68995.1 conserved uncharacterized protein [Stigmatella aurantiaca DW4/3-1]EAU69033.1 hypothetical protein STIAU_8694 [Stigmatella aurantiaca DW4/3-1]